VARGVGRVGGSRDEGGPGGVGLQTGRWGPQQPQSARRNSGPGKLMRGRAAVQQLHSICSSGHHMLMQVG
jgi:hypothetical protein